MQRLEQSEGFDAVLLAWGLRITCQGNEDLIQWMNVRNQILPITSELGNWPRSLNQCHAWLCAKSLQSCSTLWGPMDCILPGFSVRGILQAGILEWVAISSSGDLPYPGIELTSLESPALAGGFFTTSATWEVQWVSQSWLISWFYPNEILPHCDWPHTHKHCEIINECSFKTLCLLYLLQQQKKT